MIKDYIEADSDLVRTSEDETSFENPDSLLPKSIENVEFNENENIYGEGINVLLRLIKYAHTDANSKNTGLTNLFDFSSFFTRLQYYNSQTRKIDCKALKRFIDSYYLYCTDHDIDYLVKDSFVNYLEENYEYVSDAKKSAFKTFIDCNWEDIKNRIIYSMVSNSALWIIIGSNTLTSVTCSNLTFTVCRIFTICLFFKVAILLLQINKKYLTLLIQKEQN